MSDRPTFAAYRLQLPPNAHWTEWRPIDQPVTEPLVLSVQWTDAVTKEQGDEFLRQLEGH